MDAEIIAAVDLLGGRVVRLSKGDPDTWRTYPQLEDPVVAAKKWEAEGADALHVVDLDGALGRGNNREAIRRITKATELPLQVGGGIRNAKSMAELAEMEVQRVVLGTMAFENPKLLQRFLMRWGSARVIVALDYSGDEVRTRGWMKSTGERVLDALSNFRGMGARQFLLTSISRDGVFSGPDLKTLSEASEHSDLEIIASGGISSVNDLRDLQLCGVHGAIIGKALYEGMITLGEAKRWIRSGI